MPASAAAAGEHMSEQVDEIRAWVLARPVPECHILDALARFSHRPSFDIDAIFATLQRQGMLVRRSHRRCFCAAVVPLRERRK